MKLNKNTYTFITILSYIAAFVVGLSTGYVLAVAIQHASYVNYHSIDNRVDEIECFSADHTDCHTEYIYDSANQFIVDDELIYRY